MALSALHTMTSSVPSLTHVSSRIKDYSLLGMSQGVSWRGEGSDHGIEDGPCACWQLTSLLKDVPFKGQPFLRSVEWVSGII